MSAPVDVLAVQMGKRMRRWSAEKLDKEYGFAVACNDGSDECNAWQRAIENEGKRRTSAALNAAALARIGGAA